MPIDSIQTQQDLGSASTEYQAIYFMMLQTLAEHFGMTVVKVLSCTNDGGLSQFGFVNVQPLVNQIDGAGLATPHSPLPNLPYFRLQGGANAVILDPQPGDIGFAMFADRDISTVKRTQAQANPGSRRRKSLSDGIYVGGILNGVPTQYVQFNTSGITITSPTAVTINAPSAVVNASASATVSAPSISLQNSGAALKTLLNSVFATWAAGHVHSNGNGGANTGAPTTSAPAGSQTSTVQAE